MAEQCGKEGVIIIPPVDPVPGGGDCETKEVKDVNFYDYDGNIIESYTAEEFASLGAFPANPEHDGLNAQGWNWTLENAQSFVEDYGKLNIGQSYITKSGATELDIELIEGRTSPVLGLAIEGEVSIDWGDGSAPDTATGSNPYTIIGTSHTYASPGKYTISITSVSGVYYLMGESSRSKLLCYATAYNEMDYVYTNSIIHARVGENAIVGYYAFGTCWSLETVTLPEGLTGLGGYAFNYCSSLEVIVVPSGVTEIGSYCCQNANGIRLAVLSDTVATIGQYAFGGCYILDDVVIPSSVTSLGESAYRNDYGLRNVTLGASVTSISSSAFASCQSLAEIDIPEGVTEVMGYAFDTDTALIRVVLPSTIQTIRGFTVCRGLGAVHVKATTPPTIYSNTFDYSPPDCVFYVPAESLSDYQTASNWSTYASQMVGE